MHNYECILNEHCSCVINLTFNVTVGFEADEGFADDIHVSGSVGCLMDRVNRGEDFGDEYFLKAFAVGKE